MSQDTRSDARGSTHSYVAGFVLSLGLTLVAYLLVVNGSLAGGLMMAALASLAIAQLMVQLVFFLHLGRESKPRWNLMVLLFALTVILIVVFGSLWIMQNLNYHMHSSPQELDQQILKDEGVEHKGAHY